jgi:hypothetical protein
MFEHVEDEYWITARDGLCVIIRPRIDQPLTVLVISQNDPAGAAAKRFAHANEFRAPAIKGAKIALDRFVEWRALGFLPSPKPAK